MRRPLSLTLRLGLLFSGVAVLTLVAVGAYLYHTLERQMAYRDDAELVGRVALVRRLLAAAPSAEAVERAPDAVLATVFGHDEFVLRVATPGGRVLLQSGAPSRPLPAAPGVPAGRAAGLADVRDWRPALGRGRLLGAVGMAGGPQGTPLHISVALERSDRLVMLRRYASDVLLAVCMGAAMATLLGFVIVRLAMRPLRSVVRKANAISAQRLDTRLSVADAPAELRALASAFNAMLERLEEGVQRLSGFAADLAHDLRTPVNALMLETQVALARPRSAQEYQALLVSNADEYERLARMIENTLFLARADHARQGLRRERLDAGRELRRIGDYFEGLAEDAGVSLAVDCGALWLSADALLLQRAVGNLVSNAIRHTPGGGSVRLSAAARDGGLDIVVGNSGPGIDAAHLPHIFERYYRADPARAAGADCAGLGLAIVKAIMAMHGGAVAARSEGGWTTFRLSFAEGGAKPGPAAAS